MAPKRKREDEDSIEATFIASHSIEATFIANYSIDWQPGLSNVVASQLSQASSQSSDSDDGQGSKDSQGFQELPLPTTDQEVIERFQQYLRGRIRRLEKGTDGSDADYMHDRSAKCNRADEKKCLLTLLAISLDPFAVILGLDFGTMQRAIKRFGSLEPYFRHSVIALQTAIEKLDQLLSRSRGGENDSDNRSKEDKAAQSEVLEWYEDHCVLTGGKLAQGAHIIPVQATNQSLRDGFLAYF